MDQAYFKNEENWARMVTELESWKGTPYRHLTMHKGRGADCTLFIGGVWKALGILTDIQFDYYPKDWHEHTQEELVLESILHHYRDYCIKGISIEQYGPLETSELIRGDILTFNYPARGIQVSHHAAIWMGYIPKTKQKDIMINAVEKRGVIEMQYGSFWQRRLTHIFRVIGG